TVRIKKSFLDRIVLLIKIFNDLVQLGYILSPTGMLPEFLFSVGSSMQDISREEFSLMNGGCDKDTTRITCNESPLDNIKLGRIPDNEPVSIKIEEPDIYSWNSSTDIGSNLLRHSDDPLISGGAIDDNQNEFNPITNCDTELSPITPKKKSTRTRRKGQFKLRFHHQALPQEYLDHYEASQISLQKKEVEQNKRNADMETNDHLKAVRTHESVRNWLQKISEYQTTSASSSPPKQEMSNEVGVNVVSPNKKSGRVVSYNDLPYMGEMTLDNSKPRRGRKPKKADICHLIYKNYGTILPGTPKEQHMKNCDKSASNVPIDQKKVETQTKIMSSLLEKRLTHESKRLSPSITSDDKPVARLDAKQQMEPLNLCLRDRSDTLTLSSDDESDTLLESSKTSPLVSPTPSETDAFLAANLKTSLPSHSLGTQPQRNEPSTPDTASTLGSENPSGYVFWPPAGVFIHPMALYYQKMVDSGKSAVATTSSPTTPSTVSSTPSPMLTESSSGTPKSEPSVKILIPKNISEMLKQEPVPSTTSSNDVASHSSKSTTPAPQKRKRSAIFIPPMPLETSNSHPTEVSICKFKFTGGAKPSLQEKKMLSVDSGGNFRYYSGTGDKSMRGYEFFPRESLQQSSLLTDSSSGAFLNTAGEKISVDLPPPSHGLSNELLQIPEILNPSQLESAEGATYCKFRQLRKFTRYLFRSWKDYLPGELQAEQAAGNSDLQASNSQNRPISSPATTPCLEQNSSSME
ncbi:hypothetical protein Bhyg_00596, partial [Pseudolycoriella hygida]